MHAWGRTEVDHGGLSSVVRRLQLRDVRYMAADGRGRNERAVALLLKPFPGGPGGVVDAVKVGRDDLAVHFMLQVGVYVSSDGRDREG